MPMVGHQAVGQQPHRHGVQRMGHHPLEGGIVFVLLKNTTPTHAAIEDVKDDAAGSFSQTAWHDLKLLWMTRRVN